MRLAGSRSWIVAMAAFSLAGAALWGGEHVTKDSSFLARRIGAEDAGLSQVINALFTTPRADGGGASVANVLAVQFGYLDEDDFRGQPASLLALTWTDPTFNANGIQVLANGIPLVDVDTGSTILDGSTTSILVIAYAGGATRFEVVGDNIAADDIVILEHQPFDDPVGFLCEGGVRNPKDGTCDLSLLIPAARPPDFFFIAFDNGSYLTETIPGSERVHTFPDYRPATYNITLLGAISQDGNDYLGDPTSSTCSLVCKDLPCDSPQQLASCQSDFGPNAADNKVSLSWVNGETYYTEIRFTLDDQPQNPLKGDTTEMVLENLAPGDHQLSLQGDCGEKGTSDPATHSFKVLDAFPQVAPISDLVCRFTRIDSSRLFVSWKNNSSASYIELYLVDPQDNRRKVLTVAGQATSATLEGTAKTDRLALRAVYQQNGSCFAADFSTCTPKPPPGFKYLTGDCDGNSNTNLTDPIFALNFLFKGGDAPTCEAACDSNTDGHFDLGDAIFTLNNLFLGGPPPGGRFPACDESGPEQSCSQTTCLR